MGWVRLHRRFGARLGLAALVLQLALSFGHIHVGNVHVEGVAKTVFGLGKASSAVLAESQHKAPAHNQTPGDTEDYCAICASIFLASTSLAAQPPLLPLPLTFQRVTLTFSTEQALRASRPAFFQSRAPPDA